MRGRNRAAAGEGGKTMGEAADREDYSVVADGMVSCRRCGVALLDTRSARDLHDRFHGRRQQVAERLRRWTGRIDRGR